MTEEGPRLVLRGVIGSDLAKGGRVRRAVAFQLRLLRRDPRAADRLAELRAAWSTPDRRLRLAVTLPQLWQAHIALYCRQLRRLGIAAPKRHLAQLVGVDPITVSRWLRPVPVRPGYRSRVELTLLMPDIQFPHSWR